ncbi:hypothetical protein U1Q18_032964 [Sarracenia purpurea var. burkii]
MQLGDHVIGSATAWGLLLRDHGISSAAAWGLGCSALSWFMLHQMQDGYALGCAWFCFVKEPITGLLQVLVWTKSLVNPCMLVSLAGLLFYHVYLGGASVCIGLPRLMSWSRLLLLSGVLINPATQLL